MYTCPGVLGGLQWSSPAFNPGANLLFAPAVDWCGTFKKADEPRYIPGQLYMGGSYTPDPMEKSQGWLTAFNASTGEVAWKYQSKRPLAAAVTATSAQLILTGELTGVKIPDSISKEYKAHYADLDIYGTLNFTNNIGVQGGFRSVDVGYHVDSDTGSFVLKGIYFGVVARY